MRERGGGGERRRKKRRDDGKKIGSYGKKEKSQCKL